VFRSGADREHRWLVPVEGMTEGVEPVRILRIGGVSWRPFLVVGKSLWPTACNSRTTVSACPGAVAEARLAGQKRPTGISTMSEELAGRLTESGHALRVRVYFEDTDFSGVVYHARYLHFLERGRSDFLRLKGIGHRE